MEQLIESIDIEGKVYYSARSLHKFLTSKKDFSDWIKQRIAKYGLIDGHDFTTFQGRSENGRETKEYYLKPEAGKELAMVEGNAKGKEARLWFIKCEKALQQLATQAPALPTPAEVILMLAQQQVDAERKILHLESRTSELEAKLITSESDYYTVMGFAKLSGVTLNNNEAIHYGKEAKKHSTVLGFTVGKIKDPRFGTVNTYSAQVLEQIIRKQVA